MLIVGYTYSLIKALCVLIVGHPCDQGKSLLFADSGSYILQSSQGLIVC